MANFGEKELLDKAIGGWRGLIDSGLPASLFVLVFVLQRDLENALLVAIVVGIILLLIRLFERKSLLQVFGGFVGLLISAYFTWRTKEASNFFLIGLLTNAIYAIALVVSLAIKKPLLGYVVSSLVNDGNSWLKEPLLRRAYTTITWFWVGVFSLRLIIQVPLYLVENVAALGTFKIVMGWPLYLFAVWLSYRVVQTARKNIN